MIRYPAAPSIRRSFRETDARSKLAMIFLMMVAAISLLVFLTWVGLLVYSAIMDGMRAGLPNLRKMRELLVTLLNCAAAACLLRILLGDSRGWRLEIGAAGAIVLSAVLFSGPSLQGMVTASNEQIFVLLWSVINTACPLAFLGAMTFLRRTPWMKNR